MKSYFDRKYLIESILNEDVALDAPTSPRKRSNFVTDTNERGSATASKGGQSKAGVKAGQLIFRKPTASEIDAVADKFNRNLGGDRQIVQIRALSKVLFDFDLLDKVYKSKKDDWNYGKSNSAEIDKQLSNLRRIFAKYEPDAPVEELAEDLENSTSRLEDEYGVRIPEIIGAIDSWQQILTRDPRTKSTDFPNGFNPILMKNIEAVTSGDFTSIYKKVSDLLVDAAVSYKTPKEYAKHVANNETLRVIFDEAVVKRGFAEAMSSNKVQDIEELQLFLNAYLNKNRIAKEEGNTMTIMHDIALKRIRHFDLIMKRKGFENGIRDFNETIDFLKEYKPEVYEHICRTYNLNDESIHQFDNYSEFCDWLFGNPDRLNEILLSVPTKVGSRTKGAIAKGMDMAVRRKELMRKEENIRNELDKPAGTTKRGKKARTIEEIEQEMERIENIRQELKKDLAERRSRNEMDTPEYAEIKKLEFDAGKQYAALKLTLKKRKAAGDTQTVKSLEDRLMDYREKREQLEDRVFDRLSDDAEIEEFNREFNRNKTRETSGEFDLGSGYRTMAFSLKVSPKETEIVDFIINKLDKYLNKKELDAGKEDLINVDYEPGRYNGGMRMYPCTRFVVDYPEKSALFRKIKDTPKKERGTIIADIISNVQKEVHKEFGVAIGLVTNDPEHKIKLMSKQEASFSFRD